jgi:glucose/mannose-6-phosphate isomerase
MVNLDSPLVHQKYDRSVMFNHPKQFPEQCYNAWDKVMKYKLPADYSQVNKVVISGMGGSAIGGEVVSDLLKAENTVPVFIQRDFNLPRFVDDKTLLIVVSYSGNTEETLSAFQDLMRTPAKKLVLTSGGRLGELAQKENVFLSIIDYPAPPRAAFPYIFGSLVGIFNKLGISSEKSTDMQKTISFLKQMVGELDIAVPSESNRAKQLAQLLHNNIIVIYGAGVLTGVARRWKTQFNENSKNWAFFEIFPELTHNAVVGYSFPMRARKAVFIVLLKASSLHPRVKVQYEAVTKILEENGIPFQAISGAGENTFTQVLGLILLGDFTSYYLAILNRADPTPASVINFVKQYLVEHQGG